MSRKANDLVFAFPTGYIEQRNGEVIILAPATTDERTPCLYGLAGRQPSPGNLEADAEAALVRVVVPGWRRLDDWHYAMRGHERGGLALWWKSSIALFDSRAKPPLVIQYYCVDP